MDTEKRLRSVIRDAEPTDGRKFAHWFDGGFYILIRKTKAQLWKGEDSKTGVLLFQGPRDGNTYAKFAELMGL